MSNAVRIGFAVTVLIVAASSIYANVSEMYLLQTCGGRVPMAFPTAACFLIVSIMELMRKNGGNGK